MPPCDLYQTHKPDKHAKMHTNDNTRYLNGGPRQIAKRCKLGFHEDEHK